VGRGQEEGREREEKKWAAGREKKRKWWAGYGVGAQDKKKGFPIYNSRRLRDIQRGFGTNLLRT
jgi:hypothetical protein